MFSFYENLTTPTSSAIVADTLSGHTMRTTTSQTIHTITLSDPHYPPLLKTIPKPPAKLYVRGDLNALRNPNTIAVVGTRRATTYGINTTKSITAALIQSHYTIISGLALGIDGIAHQTTLDRQGITVAILGTGLTDKEIAPPSHYPLAQQILAKGGALISEYPPHTAYGRWTFAARNRIIAGMSQASVIIEAAEKSGALITANHALDFNRDVFALPGPITSETSRGTNLLISKGAIPILDDATIPNHYGHTIPLNLTTPQPSFSNPLTTQIHRLCITQKLPPELAAHELKLSIQTVLTHLTMIELKK